MSEYRSTAAISIVKSNQRPGGQPNFQGYVNIYIGTYIKKNIALRPIIKQRDYIP